MPAKMHVKCQVDYKSSSLSYDVSISTEGKSYRPPVDPSFVWSVSLDISEIPALENPTIQDPRTNLPKNSYPSLTALAASSFRSKPMLVSNK